MSVVVILHSSRHEAHVTPAVERDASKTSPHPTSPEERELPAAGAGAAGVAFAAGAGADEGELAAFGAGVAFVALEAGQADSLIQGDAHSAFGSWSGTLVAVAVAVFGEGMEVFASGHAESRLRL